MTPAAPAATLTVGAACTPQRDDPRGGCPQSLTCMPGPGGYCTARCDADADCGAGGVCADIRRAGQFCVKGCQRDGDCRVGDGYYCDPNGGVCMHRALPGVVPRPPVCAAPALARGTFGRPTQVTTRAGGSVSDQEVHATLDPDGNVRLAYIARDETGRPNPLGLASVMRDGAARGDGRLPDGRDNHFDPWMAADRGGRLYLAWLGFDGGTVPEKRMQIGFASSVDGERWTETAAAHDPADCPDDKPGCLDKPMMAVGPDRADPRRDAIYLSYLGERGNVVVKSIDGGRSFGPGVVVTEYGYGDIRVDARGVVHMVNTTVGPRQDDSFGSDGGAIDYVRSDDGGATFTRGVRASAPGRAIPGVFVNPQVAADGARGRVFVAYASGTPDLRWDIMVSVSSDGGATWTHHRVNDDAPCANHMLPAMALDEVTGRVHITWAENRSGTGQLAYTSCGVDGCAANERVSDAPYAAYSLVRHATKWLGDYHVTLVDSRRRVVHAVWAQPVTETVDGRDLPVARIFHAARPL